MNDLNMEMLTGRVANNIQPRFEKAIDRMYMRPISADTFDNLLYKWTRKACEEYATGYINLGITSWDVMDGINLLSQHMDDMLRDYSKMIGY